VFLAFDGFILKECQYPGDCVHGGKQSGIGPDTKSTTKVNCCGLQVVKDDDFLYGSHWAIPASSD
jgi:hypothetical protein